MGLTSSSPPPPPPSAASISRLLASKVVRHWAQRTTGLRWMIRLSSSPTLFAACFFFFWCFWCFPPLHYAAFLPSFVLISRPHYASFPLISPSAVFPSSVGRNLQLKELVVYLMLTGGIMTALKGGCDLTSNILWLHFNYGCKELCIKLVAGFIDEWIKR